MYHAITYYIDVTILEFKIVKIRGFWDIVGMYVNII